MRSDPTKPSQTWRQLILGLFGVVVFTGGAAAQAPGVINAGDQTSEDGSIEPLTLDPLVVTARREEEDLGNVPVSVGVVRPSLTIENPSDGAVELGRRVPNYAVTDSTNPRQSFAAIRGVGTITFPLTPFDTTVTYTVNETPLSLFAGFHQLLDLQRVEVLRGPQNILFGRSSQGGTINYVTREPDGVFDARLNGQIGTDGEFLGDVAVGGAIVPGRVNGRAAFRYTGGDGFVTNIPTGELLPDREIAAGRASLRLMIDERTQIDLMAFHEIDDRETANVFLSRTDEAFPASQINPAAEFDRELTIITADLQRSFDSFDLTGSFGFQRMIANTIADSTDGLLFGPAFGLPPEVFDTEGTDVFGTNQRELAFSGEVRAASAEDAELRWITGVSAYVSDFNTPFFSTSSINPGANGTNETTLNLTDLSAFGEVGVPVTNRLTVAPGLRMGFVRSERSDVFRSNGTPGILPIFAEDTDFEDVFVAGGVTVDYRLSDEALLFASVKRGYASGGLINFSQNAPFGVPVEPFPSSVSWSYEIGGRATLFDGRVSTSAALFFNDVKDGHVQAFDIIGNVGVVEPLDYRTYGFEADATMAVTDWATAFLAAGYTETEFVDPPDGSLSGAVDGARVPNVPRWQIASGFDTAVPLTDIGLPGDLTTQFEAQFVDRRPVDIANTFDLDAFLVLNAQLGWQHDHIHIYAFGRNLTNEVVETTGTSFGPGIEGVGVASTDRVIGVGTTIRF